MKYLRLYILFLLVALVSCKQTTKEYTIATLKPGTSYHQSGKGISEILKPQGIVLDVIIRKDLGPHDNCKMLWNEEVDFAITQNDIFPVDFLDDGMKITDSKIRSVMPLYPEMLFIIHHDSLSPKSLNELIIGRRIGLGPKNSGTAHFFKIFLNHFGIDTSQYTVVHSSWDDNIVSPEIDVSISLAGFHTPQVDKMLMNMDCELFGFSDIELYRKGSSIDGFCMNYRAAHPIIIPKNTFGVKPHKPILTVAIDAVLLCRTDINEYEIFSMVKGIFEQKNILAESTPILEGISDDFNPNHLSFPIHAGALRYLHKDEPSFLERYAEILGVIISIVIAIIGGVAGLFRLFRQKRKNRVDKFYMELQEVEKKLNNNYEPKLALKEIESTKQRAVKKLVDEKLAPNESFNIFLNMYNNLYQKIHHQQNNSQEKGA